MPAAKPAGFAGPELHQRALAKAVLGYPAPASCCLRVLKRLCMSLLGPSHAFPAQRAAAPISRPSASGLVARQLEIGLQAAPEVGWPMSRDGPLACCPAPGPGHAARRLIRVPMTSHSHSGLAVGYYWELLKGSWWPVETGTCRGAEPEAAAGHLGTRLLLPGLWVARSPDWVKSAFARLGILHRRLKALRPLQPFAALAPPAIKAAVKRRLMTLSLVRGSPRCRGLRNWNVALPTSAGC